MVAESDDALYVAFLGTKHAKDHVANLDLRHVPLPGVAGGAGGARAHGGYLRRAEGIPLEQLYQLAAVQGKRLVLTGEQAGVAGLQAWVGGGGVEGLGESRGARVGHEGWYLPAVPPPTCRRPRPAAPLAPAGHSLGGAVAALCALRLLGKLPAALHSTVACVGFATPPIGNQELAEAVERMGWEDRIRNYMLPGARRAAAAGPRAEARRAAPQACA